MTLPTNMVCSSHTLKTVAPAALPMPRGAVLKQALRKIHIAAATQLCVDAAVQGDRRAALQCMLLSPGITDMDGAQLEQI